MGREGVSAGESTSPRTGLWTRPVPWRPRDGLKEQGPERHPSPSHASRHLLQTQATPPPVLNKLPAPTLLPLLLAGGGSNSRRILMQIGYVGVGVRRASLFVRSPAFGPPSHCFGSVALVNRWAAEGERKDRYGRFKGYRGSSSSLPVTWALQMWVTGPAG